MARLPARPFFLPFRLPLVLLVLLVATDRTAAQGVALPRLADTGPSEQVKYLQLWMRRVCPLTNADDTRLKELQKEALVRAMNRLALAPYREKDLRWIKIDGRNCSRQTVPGAIKRSSRRRTQGTGSTAFRRCGCAGPGVRSRSSRRSRNWTVPSRG
jgi:hypothetical protein